MKKLLFTLAFVIATPVVSTLAQDPATGRYMLMAGTFTTSTGEERKVILKINTATGQTWTYESLSLDIGKSMVGVEGWSTVKDDAMSEWQELLKRFPNGKLAAPFKR